MRDETCERARLRSDVYAALAGAFRKPEAAPDGGENSSLTDALLLAAELDASLTPLAKNAARALEVAEGTDEEEALRALEVEYNRLFVGPARPPAPPYESLYRDPGGLVMGPSAQAVQARYTEAGFAMAPDHRDLPDHVAAELAFMACLAAEGEATWPWQQRAAAFLTQHLAVWLPLFCQRVRAAGRHPFYPALADLTEAVIQWDTARLTPHRGAEDA